MMLEMKSMFFHLEGFLRGQVSSILIEVQVVLKEAQLLKNIPFLIAKCFNNKGLNTQQSALMTFDSHLFLISPST